MNQKKNTYSLCGSLLPFAIFLSLKFLPFPRLLSENLSCFHSPGLPYGRSKRLSSRFPRPYPPYLESLFDSADLRSSLSGDGDGLADSSHDGSRYSSSSLPPLPFFAMDLLYLPLIILCYFPIFMKNLKIIKLNL